jgi:hypothetical protein
MAEVTDKSVDVGYNKEQLEETVSFFLENSKIKSNGIIDIPKPIFMDQVKKHGVTQADFERVQQVTDFMTTAALGVAAKSLETKVSEASEEDLKDDTFRRGLSSTVRIPTHGGGTDVTFKAETRNPIPFRGEEGGEPQFKTSHGVTRTTINAKNRIFPDYQKQAEDRMRKALGVAETVD